MKKNIFLICFCYYSVALTFAQRSNYFGINFMPQAVSDIYFNNYQPEFSYSTGINYLHGTKSKYGIETDVLISYMKGFYLKYKVEPGIADQIIPLSDEREKLFFLKIPVLFHFQLLERTSFTSTIIAGLQPLLLLKGISEMNEITKKANPYNYSFILGLGLTKMVTKRINIFSQLRLEYVSDTRAIFNMPGYPVSLGDFFAGLMIGITFNNKPSENNQQ